VVKEKKVGADFGVSESSIVFGEKGRRKERGKRWKGGCCWGGAAD